jgi:PAS domain S-box-containing protein
VPPRHTTTIFTQTAAVAAGIAALVLQVRTGVDLTAVVPVLLLVIAGVGLVSGTRAALVTSALLTFGEAVLGGGTGPTRNELLDLLGSSSAMALTAALAGRVRRETRRLRTPRWFSGEVARRLDAFNMVGVVTTDRSGKIGYANDYFLGLLGFTRAELERGQVDERTLTPPDHEAADRNAARQLASRGFSDPFEKEYFTAAGTRKWVLEALIASGEGAHRIAFVLDIDARKRTEQAVRDREAMLLSAQRLAHLGSWEYDTETGELTWSDEMFAIFGVSRDFEPGLESVAALVHPDDRQRYWDSDDQLHEASSSEVEYRIVRPDGTQRIVLSRTERTSETRRVGTVLDVTELRRIELELREAGRRKDEFLAMLSHELRNPLAPIRTSLYVLDRAPPESAQAQRAKAIIERQTAHLVKLTEALLDATRIERGTIALHRERLDLGHTVRNTVEDHRALFSDRQLAVSLDVPEEPIWVDGDATRLAQVIANVLQNAAKYTEPGGHVSVAMRHEGAEAVVRVRDTGVGLDPALLEYVFEPLSQGPVALDRTAGGLGLGLPVVRGLVELHGGTVAIRSEGRGRGVEVIIRLPVLSSEPHGTDVPGAAPVPTRSRRVLIIEDNVDGGEVLKEALSMGDREVSLALSGQEGLAQARARPPDVVLCDIGLPNMDGYEVARAFRADPRLRSVHLVALTGYARPQDHQRALEAGFERHIAKPPNLSLLERTIEELAP